MLKAARSGRKSELPYAYMVQKILHSFEVPMQTETMKSHTNWNAIFGERLLKSCHIYQRRDGSWHWKKAPEPPEIPHHDDADIDDVIGGDDDDDDAPAVEPHVRGRGGVRIGPAPPAPAAPEDGWTMNHVMERLHDLSWGQQQIYSEFRGFRQSMGRWRTQSDTRLSHLEAYHRGDGRGSQEHAEEPAHGDDDEEDGDEEDEEDDTETDD